MGLKRLGVALVVVLALGAVTASGALAARGVTEKRSVRTGASATTTTVLTGKQGFTASLTSVGATLESEIGTTPLKLVSKQAECVACVMFNEEGGAKARGTLKLGGVTVVSPSTCQVAARQVVIEEVTIDNTWKSTANSVARFEPVPGATKLATIKLERGSGDCPIAGSYSLTGSFFAPYVAATGVYATSQTVNTSPQVNEEIGGALQLGSKPASFTAGIRFEAGGVFFGVE